MADSLCISSTVHSSPIGDNLIAAMDFSPGSDLLAQEHGHLESLFKSVKGFAVGKANIEYQSSSFDHRVIFEVAVTDEGGYGGDDVETVHLGLCAGYGQVRTGLAGENRSDRFRRAWHSASWYSAAPTGEDSLYLVVVFFSRDGPLMRHRHFPRHVTRTLLHVSAGQVDATEATESALRNAGRIENGLTDDGDDLGRKAGEGRGGVEGG